MPSSVFVQRVLAILVSGLVGAIAVGLLAPNATTLVLGILALGAGLIMALRYCLLKSIPGIQPETVSSQPWPEVPARPYSAPERPRASVINITQLRARRRPPTA